MRIAVCIAAAALSGCAVSSAGLYQTSVRMTLVSTKSATDFAACSADAMIGNPQLRGEGHHWWVIRTNGYQVPVVRWDFTDVEGGGSRAELRATININSGDERVRNCR